MGSFNVLDIVIVVILLIFSIAGFAKGFLSSLLKLFSSVASLAIGVWLAKPVAVFINGIFNLTGWFADKISGAIAGIDTFFTFVVGTDIAGPLNATDLRANIDGINEISSIVKTALKLLIKDDTVLEVGTSISGWFGETLGAVATLIVAAVLIYIVIRIAIGILSKIFDAITKNPAIGGLDRLLGLAFGAAKGALLIAVIFAVYSVLVVIPGVEQATSSILDASTLGKPIYNIVSEFVVNQIGQIDFNAIIQGAFSSVGI
ncbi:MAG: hypothetical protein CVV59_01860 [Tenericutes bacterium HGW-Tenericutes-4]|jgi:uncharacterized membrane protein required for colicin V production|nr:MAG: hypothetical protein CVV59_01860 [Tenericutes bacterium HGW-Tenericutes-4]